MEKENKLILYKDDEGWVSVNVRFADEDVWLTQAQLAETRCNHVLEEYPQGRPVYLEGSKLISYRF